jgi:serine/threonine-protein kinase
VQLAITRFGVDPVKARALFQEAVRRCASGQPADIVDMLLKAALISSAQAAALRDELDRTQIDPARSPQVRDSGRDATFEVENASGEEPAQDAPEADQNGSHRYRRLRGLGQGGMGEVYLAYDEEAERLVAIKLLWPQLATNPLLVERFKREAEHSIRLNHPNIVRGYDSGRLAGTDRWYLAMEYVDGPSVQTLLDRQGKLTIADAVRIALDIAHALEYAHSRNIVHRDIKPENILITRTGVAKLADLGLSKATDQVSNLTHTRQGFGTPYYMPYEQAINAKSADGRSDIYALGATLYHMVTGQPPFRGADAVEILEKKEAGTYPPASVLNPEVPASLDAILDKMLARDRRDRYQTASELIVDLERSGLAAAMLSFVDEELALQDPVVRKRVATESRATVPDLSQGPRRATPVAVAAQSDWWLVRLADGKGGYRQFRLPTQQLMLRIRQGRIRAGTLVGKASGGGFRKLEEWDQFQEILAQVPATKGTRNEAQPARPTPVRPVPSRWHGWLLVAAAGGLGILAILLLFMVL